MDNTHSPVWLVLLVFPALGGALNSCDLHPQLKVGTILTASWFVGKTTDTMGLGLVTTRAVLCVYEYFPL